MFSYSINFNPSVVRFNLDFNVNVLVCRSSATFFFFMDKVGQITYQEIAKVILNFKVANLIQLKMIEIFQTRTIVVPNLFTNTYLNQ